MILSLLPESSSSIFAFATNIQSGQQPLSRAFTKDLHHGWWQAVLSDGTQQATIMASSFPEEPLLPLLWAVRLLLLGVNMYLVGCQGRCNCEPIEKWPPKLNKR